MSAPLASLKVIENWDSLTEILSVAFNAWIKQDVLTALKHAFVLVGQINNVEGAFSGFQIKDRAMHIAPADIPDLRTLILFSRPSLSLENASPAL